MGYPVAGTVIRSAGGMSMILSSDSEPQNLEVVFWSKLLLVADLCGVLETHVICIYFSFLEEVVVMHTLSL